MTVWVKRVAVIEEIKGWVVWAAIIFMVIIMKNIFLSVYKYTEKNGEKVAKGKDKDEKFQSLHHVAKN